MKYDLATMDRQEVFDAACNHLLTQKRSSVKAFNGVTYCAYRSDDGLKCAAGIFIPDDKYNVEMEQRKWSDIIVRYKLSCMHQYLISDMQNIHDFAPECAWERKLREYAVDHQLNFNYKEDTDKCYTTLKQ